jgi:hypothetical protein
MMRDPGVGEKAGKWALVIYQDVVLAEAAGRRRRASRRFGANLEAAKTVVSILD